MSENLTQTQMAALKFIAETPGKSGGFYADFRVQAQTLNALWGRSLIEPLPDDQIGFRFYRARWVPTAAGVALTIPPAS